ncbi:hypothetical protein OEA41_003041 [Lepraria neglecta]|uniref:RING-type domain-containing protein n=1 Tax=Lepraria neglecta TaxID=209136 RepID=A0AAD9Z697_9LECA|nr:hypothetical protein OEA41_003041 [Lepraria neglecta]
MAGLMPLFQLLQIGDQRTAEVEQFLQQLPKVEGEKMPPESECMICNAPYDTVNHEGQTEHAVRLECDHIMGSGRISKWLLERRKNPCPYCRRELFPSREVDSYADDDEDDDDEDDDDEDDDDDDDDEDDDDEDDDDEDDDDEDDDDEDDDDEDDDDKTMTMTMNATPVKRTMHALLGRGMPESDNYIGD